MTAKEVEHLQRLHDLIVIEHNASIQETTERFAHWLPTTMAKHGLCFLGMRKTAERMGYGGKWIVDYETGIVGQQPLPPQHTFRVGDVVQIAPWSKSGKQAAKPEKETILQGVVCRVTEFVLSVALKEDASEEDAPLGTAHAFRIDKLANEVTFERMVWQLERWKKDTLSPFVKTMLCCDPAIVWQKGDEKELSFCDEHLNASQQSAVQLALEAEHVALVHGPPGTGKTQTVIEIIRQLRSRKKRLLVCGPSNISVDNIVERLQTVHVPCVRVGHPARVLQSITQCTLDVQLRQSDAAEIVGDIREEIRDALDKIGNKKTVKAERRSLYQSVKELRKDLKVREKAAVQHMMKSADIVCSTLTGCGSRTLRGQQFDVVIIDEATQAIEPECYLALALGEKAILAGDHLQLPPTIQSSKASALEKTLFSRLLKRYGEQCKTLLNTQYRMHETIMHWSSNLLYNGRLVADKSVASHLLCDLSHVAETAETSVPMVIIDTVGCNMFETAEESEGAREEGSKFNTGEADLIARYTQLLIDAGLPEEDMAIISPYNAQVALLKKLLREQYPQLEIGSVDGFQGREKEAVLISLVRSNEQGEVGFLKEIRRLNVAVTRARRHVCIVGDTATLERGGKELKSLVQYLHEHGDLRFANDL